MASQTRLCRCTRTQYSLTPTENTCSYPLRHQTLKGQQPNVISGGSGALFVIDMKTWSLIATYASPDIGSYPIWATTTANGKFTYYDDSGLDTITEINNVLGQVVATAGTPNAAPYGITLNYNQTIAYTVGRGSPQRGGNGQDIGVINVVTMKPVTDIVTTGIEGDHASLNPLHPSQLWATFNVNYETVIVNTNSDKVLSTITTTGQQHSGAFVTYTVLANGQWSGMLQSDADGLHGSFLIAQEKMLNVTSVVYGNTVYKTEDQRVLPGEPV